MQANVNYLKCPYHKSQYIQMICLTCSSNSLSCPLCLDTEHNMHQVISLKKFMSHQIPKLYKTKPNVQNLMKNMDNLGLIFKQYIEKLRKQIGHQINQLQAYFLQKQERIKQQLLFVCGEYNVKNLYENVQAAKIMIKHKKLIPEQQEIATKLKQIQVKSAQTLSDACLQIRKIIFKLKNIHNDSLDVLLNSRSFSAYQFSQMYKHPSIQLKANKMIAINKHFDNLYHCSVIVPPLSPFKNKITFSVKKSEHKCIWFGIADLQLVKTVNFQNAYKGEGASYWLWQAGGDESAQVYIQNSQNKPLVGWNFEQGDRITLFLEYKQNGKKFLHFTKNKNQQQKFSVQINSKIGSYYPCINLGDQEQSVEIINEDH